MGPARPPYMAPADADQYFGKVLRGTAKGTRLSRAQAIKTYFLYLELRHKVEIHQMTGRVVECPIDGIPQPEPEVDPASDLAISRWLGVSSPLIPENQVAASAIDIAATWLMCLPAILTASASGLSRSPPQISHVLAL